MRWLILVIPLVLAGLALLGGSILLLRLSFLSVLVALARYLWTVLNVRGLSVWVEEPPEHCQVGERFQQEVSVVNNSRLPKVWLKMEANPGLPGQQNATLINLPPGQSRSWRATVECRRRGRYEVGLLRVTATDPFGLFSRQRSLGEPYSLLIYPRTVDLPLFRLASFADFGAGPGRRPISLISPNASTVREFATGDSLHHIHWHSTAHTGRLMVKVFDADHSYHAAKTVWVVVDMEGACQAGEGEESTEEYGITIAASLVRKYLEGGMRVGMMASDGKTHLFPPDRGEEQLWRILEALALMRAGGQVPVSQLIFEQMEYLRDNAAVIIVTPSPAGELLDVTRQLRNRADSVVVVLLDAASFGGEVEVSAAARMLTLAGVQAHVVRQGDEVSRVLDDRYAQARAQYV